MKRTDTYIITAIVAACFLLMIVPASAVTITASPDAISRGGQITITMNDLKDGSQFSILIEGEFNADPGERFLFQTTSFTMPISLSGGTISATTQGTSMTSFSAKKGGTTVNSANPADENGFFSFTESTSISSGVYDYIKLEGMARDDVTTISTSMNLLGTKKGPENSQITFNVDGIDNGVIHLTVLVDSSAVLPPKTITVGNGLIPVTTVTTTEVPTTTTTVTETETTQTTTTSTTAGAGATTTTTTSSTTDTESTTAAQTSGTSSKTFYSADRKVSLATQGVDYAGFLMVKGAKLPEDWLAVGDVWTIVPDNLEFSPAATLSFTIPKTSGADYAYFIGKYENSQWTVVPSSAGTNSILARVTRPGTYSLMAYQPESSVPVSGETTVASAAGTTTAAGTPRIASVAAAATTAQASASAAPWLAPNFLIVFGALAICCALVLGRK